MGSSIFSDLKTIRVWLGGSFDPVHVGHLAIVEHIAHVLDNDSKSQSGVLFTITISLLPTARNPLKPYPTNNSHRLAMLELGLHDLKKANVYHSINFNIDTTEIYQTETVFTFNTFTHFRAMYPDDSLIFVLGMDSILMFEKWYRGVDLPSLCHLWVMPRGQNYGQEILSPLLEKFLTTQLADLINHPNGRIYLDTHRVPTLSSSQIRAALDDSRDPDLLQQWLTPSVLTYILQNNLY